MGYKGLETEGLKGNLRMGFHRRTPVPFMVLVASFKRKVFGRPSRYSGEIPRGTASYGAILGQRI